MTDYLSYKWFKARTGMTAMAPRYGLTASDIGLYYALMSTSKEHLLDGYLTIAEGASVGSTLKLRGWRQSLERLQSTGLLTVIGERIELDWSGQETRESIENALAKKAAAGKNGRSDIPAMHAAGDHSKCRKRGKKDDCPYAEKNARNYAPKGDSVGSSGPTQSQSQIQSHKDLDTDEDEKTSAPLGRTDGPAQAPPGQRSASSAPTLPGPSSEGEESAPNESAPTESAPTPNASTGWNWDEVY